MNKVNPNKVAKVASSLRKGKSYRQALLDNGYSKDTANMGANNKVIQEALIKNSQDFKAIEVSPESVIASLRYIQSLAIQKEDLSTAMQCEVWLGKTIAAYTDKHEITEPATKDELDSRLSRLRGLLNIDIGHESPTIET